MAKTYKSLPSTATGLAPASATSVWGYGSWISMSDSLPTGAYVIGFTFQLQTSQNTISKTYEQLFEIGIGPASSEVTKLQIPYSYRLTSTSGSKGLAVWLTKTFNVYFPEPYFIPGGTRVSIRVADSIAAAITYGGVKLLYQEIEPPTVTLNSPADATVTTNQTPTLTFTGTSSDAFDLEYRIQVLTPSLFNLVSLAQTGKAWQCIAIDSSDHDVYVAVNGGDIYKQTASTGSFVALGQTAQAWTSIAIDPSNHNVYATAYTGDIYKQTAGTGNFIALGQTVRSWWGISIDTVTKDVYAAVYDGDIYKQTAGTGNFVALGQTVRKWEDVAVDSTTHDVYAIDNTGAGGDIYKQTAGTGNFVALGQDAGLWTSISIDSLTHDVYVSMINGDICKQTAGTGNFIGMGQPLPYHEWSGIAIDSSNKNIYAVDATDIYKYVSVTVSEDKVSDADTGFVDVTNGIETHPFTSGDQISYTVQAADILSPGRYYWQVAARDPLGGNIYGNWSSLYSFSVYFTPPTVNLVFPSNAGLINNVLPTLKFTGTSLNSFDLEYDVQINNVNSFADDNFVTIQTIASSVWCGLEVDSTNKNVYATDSVDIYKQTAGTGGFVALGQTSRNYYYLAIDTVTKDVYATVYNGDIYKQTAGTGNFVALGQTTRAWVGIAVDSSNHNVYASVSGGDIYKQTAGTGNFIALSQAVRIWQGIAVDSSNHNVFCVVQYGDIYKQTAGTGDFVAMGQASREWGDIKVDSVSHDVYTVVFKGDIYKQTAGIGDFVGLKKTPRYWYGLAVDSLNKNVYATTTTGTILKMTKNVLITKASDFHTGFADITNVADNHPFASTNQISYTVQAAESLPFGGTYYWRVAAKDPSGNNFYGSWTTPQSFTIATGMKVWDGNAWNVKPAKVWSGGNWLIKPVKVWDGGAWVPKD